jgi:hypothetical protein
MSGVMLVKQKVADVAQWNTVFSDPQLDAGASIARPGGDRNLYRW